MAATISDELGGQSIALVKDASIVFDEIMGEAPTVFRLEEIIKGFVAKRKDARYYSVEADGDVIVVHSPDPLARSRGRKDSGQWLPDNLLKCPYSGCGFVTPYQEAMIVHSRIHGA